MNMKILTIAINGLIFIASEEPGQHRISTELDLQHEDRFNDFQTPGNARTGLHPVHRYTTL